MPAEIPEIDWAPESKMLDDLLAAESSQEDIISNDTDKPMENEPFSTSTASSATTITTPSSSITAPLKDFIRETSTPPLQDKRKTKKIKTTPQILDYPITTRAQAQLKNQQAATAAASATSTPIIKTKKTPPTSDSPPSEDTSMSDIEGGDSMEGDPIT